MPGTIDVERVRPALMRFCLSITGGSAWDAEDLVQESLLRALPVVQGAVPHSNPEAYVLLVAKNAWRDTLRRQRLASGKMELLPIPMEADQIDPADMELALQWLFSSLTPLQRGVYLLRDVYEFTARETASLLGLTEGAVKAALHRARQELRKNASRHREETPDAGNPSSQQQELLKAYMAAFRLGDVPRIVQLVQGELASTPYAAAIVLNTAAAMAGRGRSSAGHSSRSKLHMRLAA